MCVLLEAIGPAASSAVYGWDVEKNTEVSIPSDPLSLVYGSPEHQVFEKWQALECDCSGDELTEGGQSKKEIERIAELEKLLKSLPGVEFSTFHHFADGIYIREIWVPKDSVIVGYRHRHECMNVMLSGSVLTITNGIVTKFDAPSRVKSGADTQKASIVLEDMVWMTIHPNPTNERDIDRLEEMLLIKPQLQIE